jgi:hypothetical protein
MISSGSARWTLSSEPQIMRGIRQRFESSRKRPLMRLLPLPIDQSRELGRIPVFACSSVHEMSSGKL